MGQSTMTTIQFTVNDHEKNIEAPPMSRLLDVLREDLHLTGTKEGCGEGECGACSVMLDGKLVNSCLIPVLQVEGANVQTVEGVALSTTLQGTTLEGTTLQGTTLHKI